MAENNDGMTRRTFLKNSGFVVGGAVGGGLLAYLGRDLVMETTDQTDDQNGNGEPDDFSNARVFFLRDQDFHVLEMATETIFPEDDNGPGAIALGVPYFIDRQLAGAWGHNVREYMRGPFQEGADTQGYQSSLLRRDIFLQGVRRMNDVSQSEFDESFFDLEEDDRFDLLYEFSEGDVDMNGVSSGKFFSMLRQAVLEGVYADPVYGGNKDLAGWRMKQHPGSVMSYLDVIQEEEFVEMEPVTLKDHHG